MTRAEIGTAKLKKHFIKVFGERNTGTQATLEMIRAMPNLTTTIPAFRKTPETRDFQKRIEDRFRGRWLREYSEALGVDTRKRIGNVAAWKHTAPQFDSSFAKANAHVVFLVRNPYSWLISLAKRPYHTQGRSVLTIEQFIDFPWLTMPRDQIDAVVNSPMCLWNEKLRAYAEFQKICNIPNDLMTFEGFVKEPEASLGRVLDAFSIDSAGLTHVPYTLKKQRRSLNDLQSFYNNEQWRERLTRQSVALINKYTDWDIAGCFGYEMLDPKEFPLELPEKTAALITSELTRQTKRQIKTAIKELNGEL